MSSTLEIVVAVAAAVTTTVLIAWILRSVRMSQRSLRKIILAILVAIGSTATLILLLLNLTASEKKIEHAVVSDYGVDDPQFQRAMSNLLGPPLAAGNTVQALHNGDAYFPAMLDAIANARHTITFETFIYWSGNIGREFTDALSERARAGVKVHVLLDWVGSMKMKPELVEQMRAAGAEVERYHQIHWYTLDRMNHRTHRKLLVVDGMVGFTGGAGIADGWTGNAQDPDHYRDSQYRAEGPVVAQMQTAFMDNWLKVKSTVLHGAGYFPELPTTGTLAAQVFRSSSQEGSESARLMYLFSIA